MIDLFDERQLPLGVCNHHVSLPSAPNSRKGRCRAEGRHVVALLVAEPSLQKGQYIFECPMAQGDNKWVQTNAKISNPYMEKKMLECGGESDCEA